MATFGKTRLAKQVSKFAGNWNKDLENEMDMMYQPWQTQATAFSGFLKENKKFQELVNNATSGLIADETGGRGMGDAMALSQMLQGGPGGPTGPTKGGPPQEPPINTGIFGPDMPGAAELLFNQPPPMTMPPVLPPQTGPYEITGHNLERLAPPLQWLADRGVPLNPSPAGRGYEKGIVPQDPRLDPTFHSFLPDPSEAQGDPAAQWFTALSNAGIDPTTATMPARSVDRGGGDAMALMPTPTGSQSGVAPHDPVLFPADRLDTTISSKWEPEYAERQARTMEFEESYPTWSSMDKVLNVAEHIKYAHDLEAEGLGASGEIIDSLVGSLGMVEPDDKMRGVLTELVDNYSAELTGKLDTSMQRDTSLRVDPQGNLIDPRLDSRAALQAEIAPAPRGQVQGRDKEGNLIMDLSPGVQVPKKANWGEILPTITLGSNYDDEKGTGDGGSDVSTGETQIRYSADDATTEDNDSGFNMINFLSAYNSGQEQIWNDWSSKWTPLQMASPQARTIYDNREKELRQQYKLETLNPKSPWFVTEQEEGGKYNYRDYLEAAHNQTDPRAKYWSGADWHKNMKMVYDILSRGGVIENPITDSLEDSQYFSDIKDETERKRQVERLALTVSSFARDPQTVASWIVSMQTKNMNPVMKRYGTPILQQDVLSWALNNADTAGMGYDARIARGEESSAALDQEMAMSVFEEWAKNRKFRW